MRPVFGVRICVVLSAAALAACDWPALEPGTDSAGERFDVESGFFREVSGGALATNRPVTCRFTVNQRYFESGWGPSTSIILATNDDLTDESEDNKIFRLTATWSSDSPQTHFAYAAFGFGDDGTVLIDDIAVETDSFQLTLVARGDGVVNYSVGDEPSRTFALAEGMEKPFGYWAATASGVSGRAECDVGGGG